VTTVPFTSRDLIPEIPPEPLRKLNRGRYGEQLPALGGRQTRHAGGEPYHEPGACPQRLDKPLCGVPVAVWGGERDYPHRCATQ
jgi:hypothetical protein